MSFCIHFYIYSARLKLLFLSRTRAYKHQVLNNIHCKLAAFSPTQLPFIHLNLQHYELFNKQIKVVSFQKNNNDNTSNIIIQLDFPWQVEASSVGEHTTKVFCSKG